jgi:hypothetical protein
MAKEGPLAIDWREWRADEFVGTFLVPPGRLSQAVVRRASETTRGFAAVVVGGILLTPILIVIILPVLIVLEENSTGRGRSKSYRTRL